MISLLSNYWCDRERLHNILECFFIKAFSPRLLTTERVCSRVGLALKFFIIPEWLLFVLKMIRLRATLSWRAGWAFSKKVILVERYSSVEKYDCWTFTCVLMTERKFVSSENIRHDRVWGWCPTDTGFSDHRCSTVVWATGTISAQLVAMLSSDATFLLSSDGKQSGWHFDEQDIAGVLWMGLPKALLRAMKVFCA